MFKNFEVPFVPFVLAVFIALFFAVALTVDIGSGDARRPLVYPDGRIIWPDDENYNGLH